ncbi:rhodanese-like domain-containing protein [Streptococcus hyovaginalis]|uniref:rhodanese-like domain-containing protein n=1 Tax=Streptococcus hyovaginalis TaxID=149015 RepID=UPI002A7EABCA|nr:rhodanese-like domain-containing protein [Streptococcus hyovaginalis]MDY4510849.1 rhodanese-like domain-containing protein [Streptococcus hyovaginalis]MDY5973485.1 rhodanese-like domain-containing protein [Streptococcus hyovaginalis]
MVWTLLVLVSILVIAWSAWNYFRLKKAATFVENDEFSQLMRIGQLIDIREPSRFHQKHILGARNFPMQQFEASLGALNKEKPVLIYDDNRGVLIPRAAKILKKAGFERVYVLENGFDYWNGKVK